MIDGMLPAAAQDVLDFWFPPVAAEAAAGNPAPGGPPAAPIERPEWFRKDDAFDAQVRRRFGTVIERALAGGYGEWCITARGALARVLVLDQFTRNAFRDTPRAFAGDERARATAAHALAQDMDRALGPMERWFLYLPFEHSEALADQERALALFGALARDSGLTGPLEWAEKHAAVIRRFGRFPHRNAILGRASTAEELEFLAQPGSRF